MSNLSGHLRVNSTDPLVIEHESRTLVEHLRSIGKEDEYLMLEIEGHDVLKLENRITCHT